MVVHRKADNTGLWPFTRHWDSEKLTMDLRNLQASAWFCTVPCNAETSRFLAEITEQCVNIKVNDQTQTLSCLSELSWVTLAHGDSFLEPNTAHLSLSGAPQQSYRKRLFCPPFHCLWFQGHFLWLPQATGFLQTRKLSLDKL